MQDTLRQDAIDILLVHNPYPLAQELAEFHRANPNFISAAVAELRWLKLMGRKRTSINNLIEYFRWERPWKKTAGYAVRNDLTALMSRAVALLWPDINGMVQFRRSITDESLPIVFRRGKVYPRREEDFQTHHAENGSYRSVWSGAEWITPPTVPTINRVPTLHVLIGPDEAATAVAPLRAIVESSPDPANPLLAAWRRHFTTQPEIFALMLRKLRERNPDVFSGKSIAEYVRWSVRRAAETKRTFTLNSRFSSLYNRALVIADPQFNGRCAFAHCRVDALLGLKLAEKPINNEPYRRLEAK